MLENIYRSGLYDLLKVFYNHKSENLHFNRIVKLSSLGKGSVDRYLKMLVGEKILLIEKNANLVEYSLNNENPMTILLLTNFDKETFQSLPLNVRKVIDEIRKYFDNRFIFIFGSFAKNSFNKNSDLDIFICVRDKSLIKENDLIKKMQLQYGVKIDMQISTLNEVSENQKHIINTGLPVSNYDNFYEVYFNEVSKK